MITSHRNYRSRSRVLRHQIGAGFSAFRLSGFDDFVSTFPEREYLRRELPRGSVEPTHRLVPRDRNSDRVSTYFTPLPKSRYPYIWQPAQFVQTSERFESERLNALVQSIVKGRTSERLTQRFFDIQLVQKDMRKRGQMGGN